MVAAQKLSGKYLLALVCILASIIFLRIESILPFFYFGTLYIIINQVLQLADWKRFVAGYLIASLQICAFYLIQISLFPDSYGMTTPYGAWADDSYFFSKVADNFPVDLAVEENSLEDHRPTFVETVRYFAIFDINFPLDVIFFQAGTWSWLACRSETLGAQLGLRKPDGNRLFIFILSCPFYAMNGGIIFVRDLITCALFVEAFLGVTRYNTLRIAIPLIGSYLIRPGTAILQAGTLVLFILLSIRRSQFFPKRNIKNEILKIAGLGVTLMVLGNNIDTSDFDAYINSKKVDLGGRDLSGSDAVGDGSLSLISEKSLPIRLPLGSMYTFVSPVFSLSTLLKNPFTDPRQIILSLVTPVYAIWTNTLFFYAILIDNRFRARARKNAICFIFYCALVGTYSLQMRHKVSCLVLYYIVANYGLSVIDRKRMGIPISISLIIFLVTVAFDIRRW